MGQQGVFLTLDEATLACLPSGRTRSCGHDVERLAQMAQDVELVEQDRRLRGVRAGGVAKRLPHVHHRQTELFGLLFPKKSIELVHARFRAILAAEPDRPRALQITDHDPVDMALADRDLIDADGLGTNGARTRAVARA